MSMQDHQEGADKEKAATLLFLPASPLLLIAGYLRLAVWILKVVCRTGTWETFDVAQNEVQN